MLIAIAAIDYQELPRYFGIVVFDFDLKGNLTLKNIWLKIKIYV